jgi:hypothetical protein
MTVLIDTDIFCKLGSGNLLEEAAIALGFKLTECGRLPALPHMLRKGKLQKTYGETTCSVLQEVADGIAAFDDPSALWLDRFAPFEAIDPGEALIFAAAAEHGHLVMTSDKRSLHALKDVPGFPEVIAGRIVVLEAVMLELCKTLGPDEVWRRAQSMARTDTMIKICCSSANPDPRSGLLSYFQSLETSVNPLVLWTPEPGETG